MLDLHPVAALVQAGTTVHPLRRLPEQKGQPAPQRKRRAVRRTHSAPSRSALIFLPKVP